MKLYSALIKRNPAGKIADIILLKEGFSFYAFLFGPFWFFYHKMWQEFIVLLAVNIAFGLSGNPSDFGNIFLEISLLLIVAFNATYWRGEYLKKNNYEFTGLIFGSDLANAKLRFVQNLNGKCDNFDDSILNPKLHRKVMKLQDFRKRFFA